MYWQLAPAKINLSLTVGAKDARGFHPLRSHVVFCSIGDFIGIDYVALGEGEGKSTLSIDGPFAAQLHNDGDNFCLKAVEALSAFIKKPIVCHMRLIKNLPIASGIGGGTSDGATTLNALIAALKVKISAPHLLALYAKLGSDGPMCGVQRPLIAESYGEKLTFWRAKEMHIVLINDLTPCSTRDIFHHFDREGKGSDLSKNIEDPHVFDLNDGLFQMKNDLEETVCALFPSVDRLLKALKACREAKIVRMSGSGATCFAICATKNDALTLKNKIALIFPKVWIEAGTILSS